MNSAMANPWSGWLRASVFKMSISRVPGGISSRCFESDIDNLCQYRRRTAANGWMKFSQRGKSPKSLKIKMKIWTAAIGLAWTAFAQSGAPDAHLTFDVASVKLNTAMGTNSSLNRANGGQLNCVNVNLRQLIAFAYSVQDYQILNAPGWAETDHYDILAKPSPADAANEKDEGFSPSSPSTERLRKRTQALLEDRFGLTVHNESREMSVYALVVAIGGPKLEPTKTELGPQNSWNDRRVICKKQTMKGFAETVLSSRFNRFVVDQTGL